LSTYNKCSYFFWRFYVDQSLPRPDTDTFSTVLGNLCHDVLEAYYLQFAEEPPLLATKTVDQLLDEHWVKRLTEDGILPLLDSLKAYEQNVAWLYYRASEACTTPDAIRSGKGAYRKVPTKPEMTSDWKKAWVEMGLDEASTRIQQYAAAVAQQRENERAAAMAADPEAKPARLKSRHWLKLSLQEVYAQSYKILRGYRDPVLGTLITAVEYQLSRYDEDFKHMENAVQLRPAKGDGRPTYLTGFIDLIVTDAHNRVYIIDHKTSKGEAPSEYKVRHWEQLLLYGWAWTQLTGKAPDFICINHLRSRTLVCAPFDPKLAEGALGRKLAAVKGIDAEVFIQSNPADFNTPCIGSDGEPCGYLYDCHPEFFAAYTADRAKQSQEATTSV
jgi:hypothetical protein